MSARTTSTTSTRTTSRRPQASCSRDRARSGSRAARWTGRTFAPCTARRRSWSRVHARAAGRRSCSRTRIATTATTSATSTGRTTARRTRSGSGATTAIRSRCTACGSRRRRSRRPTTSGGSRTRRAPRSSAASPLRSPPRTPTRARCTRMSSPSVVATGTRTLTFAQAINEALAEELRRDPTVFVLGEDVAEAGTPFKVLSGLVDEFGAERVVDSPISEAGITGLGVGAAITGMRPVVDIMFGDFLTLVMDQLANQAAKTHYMSGGRLKVPLTLRTTMGATRRSAAQHSQSLHAWVAHVPGLKVVLPSEPADAKGLLKSAIRDDNPVVFIEDKMDYAIKGD